MTFSCKVIEAFFDYNHDFNEDHSIVAAIYRLIYRYKNASPGYFLFIETQIRKSGDQCNLASEFFELVKSAMNNILTGDWSWSQISRLFYAINLIDDVASFRLVPSEQKRLREIIVEIVGRRLSFIEEMDWKVIPIIELAEEETHQFNWIDFALGAAASLVLRRYF